MLRRTIRRRYCGDRRCYSPHAKNVTDRKYSVAKPGTKGENLPIGNLVIKRRSHDSHCHATRSWTCPTRGSKTAWSHSSTAVSGCWCGFAVYRRSVGRQAQLRLEHVLRVVDSLGGELTLNGFASNHPATAPATANAHDAARLQALDELTAQAQELKMGYE